MLFWLEVQAAWRYAETALTWLRKERGMRTHSRKLRMAQGRDLDGEQEVCGTRPAQWWVRNTPNMGQEHFIQWTGARRS